MNTKERKNEANSYNKGKIMDIIDHLERDKNALETWTEFGKEIKTKIENYIMELECLKNDY